MAALSQTWSVFTAVTMLAVQLCAGENSCVIWSTAGSVVQRGSSFKVYCSFKCECKCKGAMCSDHPPTGQGHRVLNSTTIYFNVVNITRSRTYSCQCDCPRAPDSCGMDISTGYPPDRPDNISCIHKVRSHESEVAFCTWNPGRDTYLTRNSVLHVKTPSENGTFGPVAFSVSSEGHDSASFPVSSLVQLISVSVTAQNALGSVASSPVVYRLSDIAMPSAPNIGEPECSSRACTIQVKQSVRTQHLEIQYSSKEQAWTSYIDTGLQMSLVQVQSVSSLEPYRLYHFRARSKFSTGLWSPWSKNVSSCTQEEAPAKELDVWFARPASDVKSLRVYWKEENISIARGRITGYKVSVHSHKSGLVFSTNISADVRNYLVPFCADCDVTVWSRNAKGLSPPARVPAHHREAEPLEVRLETLSNHSVAIYWKKPKTTQQHATAYVVEWFPEGHKLEELRWIRLGTNDSRALITEIEPYECYEGAVYVVYNDGSVSRTGFTGVTTLKSVPRAVPSVLETVEGNKVEVSWMEIPRGQRGGCITRYTIHLESGSGDCQAYSIPASKRTYTIKSLSPAAYSLWVTASTTVGEGPAGQRSKVKFFIQQETPLLVLLMLVLVFLIALLFACLYQTSAGKRRLKVFLKCLMPDEVPDPANSKWAKECTKEKGKMMLHLQPGNSIVTQEEEEPIMVDVEELPEQSDIGTTAEVGPQLRRQTSTTEPDVLLYPPTTYIKSLSHDSNSSNHTQTSLDTNMTVDYISSHGLGYMDEEDQEEEEDEEEFVDTMGFYPSQNIVIDPMLFRGKLTLDTVKMDCGSLFQNINF